MNETNIFDGFTGVFPFTNWTDEDFTALWNNKEYTFPKKSTSPLLINEESAENIQEIRKRFAFRLAEREFYNSKQYKQMVKIGKAMPSTFDPKILEPMIQKCLIPLAIKQAKIKTLARDSERSFKASKAISADENLKESFKDMTRDENIPKVGATSTSLI